MRFLFKKGDWVKIHPATDLWMKGIRYGTVTKTREYDNPPAGVVRPLVPVSWSLNAKKIVLVHPKNLEIIGTEEGGK